jgi:NADPH:quinone reductase-like Zn-dependent oxidoreductase
VVYARHGGPEVLELCEVPVPIPRENEVLVRVRATAVNPVDWKLRQGRFRPALRVSLPMIPGCDVAGEVVEAGAEVSRFRPGEAVFAALPPTRGGAAAEQVAVPERWCARKPSNLSFEEAAALPLVALAALQGLRDHGRLERGERLLIHGAAGGVGTTAIQVARALGARVTAAARGPRQDLLRGLGAAAVLDARREDFARAREVWDVIFDVAGTRSFRECLGVLSQGGRFVTTHPRPASVAAVVGSWLLALLGYRRRAEVLMVRPRGTDLTYLAGLAEQGKLRPVVDSVVPLASLAAAHQRSETGGVGGKLVVRVE